MSTTRPKFPAKAPFKAMPTKKAPPPGGSSPGDTLSKSVSMRPRSKALPSRPPGRSPKKAPFGSKTFSSMPTKRPSTKFGAATMPPTKFAPSSPHSTDRLSPSTSSTSAEPDLSAPPAVEVAKSPSPEMLEKTTELANAAAKIALSHSTSQAPTAPPQKHPGFAEWRVPPKSMVLPPAATQPPDLQPFAAVEEAAAVAETVTEPSDAHAVDAPSLALESPISTDLEMESDVAGQEIGRLSEKVPSIDFEHVPSLDAQKRVPSSDLVMPAVDTLPEAPGSHKEPLAAQSASDDRVVESAEVIREVSVVVEAAKEPGHVTLRKSTVDLEEGEHAGTVITRTTEVEVEGSVPAAVVDEILEAVRRGEEKKGDSYASVSTNAVVAAEVTDVATASASVSTSSSASSAKPSAPMLPSPPHDELSTASEVEQARQRLAGESFAEALFEGAPVKGQEMVDQESENLRESQAALAQLVEESRTKPEVEAARSADESTRVVVAQTTTTTTFAETIAADEPAEAGISRILSAVLEEESDLSTASKSATVAEAAPSGQERRPPTAVAPLPSLVRSEDARLSRTEEDQESTGVDVMATESTESTERVVSADLKEVITTETTTEVVVVAESEARATTTSDISSSIIETERSRDDRPNSTDAIAIDGDQEEKKLFSLKLGRETEVVTAESPAAESAVAESLTILTTENREAHTRAERAATAAVFVRAGRTEGPVLAEEKLPPAQLVTHDSISREVQVDEDHNVGESLSEDEEDDVDDENRVLIERRGRSRKSTSSYSSAGFGGSHEESEARTKRERAHSENSLTAGHSERSRKESVSSGGCSPSLSSADSEIIDIGKLKPSSLDSKELDDLRDGGKLPSLREIGNEYILRQVQDRWGEVLVMDPSQYHPSAHPSNETTHNQAANNFPLFASSNSDYKEAARLLVNDRLSNDAAYAAIASELFKTDQLLDQLVDAALRNGEKGAAALFTLSGAPRMNVIPEDPEEDMESSTVAGRDTVSFTHDNTIASLDSARMSHHDDGKLATAKEMTPVSLEMETTAHLVEGSGSADVVAGLSSANEDREHHKTAAAPEEPRRLTLRQLEYVISRLLDTYKAQKAQETASTQPGTGDGTQDGNLKPEHESSRERIRPAEVIASSILLSKSRISSTDSLKSRSFERNSQSSFKESSRSSSQFSRRALKERKGEVAKSGSARKGRVIDAKPASGGGDLKSPSKTRDFVAVKPASAISTSCPKQKLAPSTREDGDFFTQQAELESGERAARPLSMSDVRSPVSYIAPGPRMQPPLVATQYTGQRFYISHGSMWGRNTVGNTQVVKTSRYIRGITPLEEAPLSLLPQQQQHPPYPPLRTPSPLLAGTQHQAHYSPAPQEVSGLEPPLTRMTVPAEDVPIRKASSRCASTVKLQNMLETTSSVSYQKPTRIETNETEFETPGVWSSYVPAPSTAAAAVSSAYLSLHRNLFDDSNTRTRLGGFRYRGSAADIAEERLQPIIRARGVDGAQVIESSSASEEEETSTSCDCDNESSSVSSSGVTTTHNGTASDVLPVAALSATRSSAVVGRVLYQPTRKPDSQQALDSRVHSRGTQWVPTRLLASRETQAPQPPAVSLQDKPKRAPPETRMRRSRRSSSDADGYAHSPLRKLPPSPFPAAQIDGRRTAEVMPRGQTALSTVSTTSSATVTDDSTASSESSASTSTITSSSSRSAESSPRAAESSTRKRSGSSAEYSSESELATKLESMAAKLTARQISEESVCSLCIQCNKTSYRSRHGVSTSSQRGTSGHHGSRHAYRDYGSRRSVSPEGRAKYSQSGDRHRSNRRRLQDSERPLYTRNVPRPEPPMYASRHRHRATHARPASLCRDVRRSQTTARSGLRTGHSPSQSRDRLKQGSNSREEPKRAPGVEDRPSRASNLKVPFCPCPC